MSIAASLPAAALSAAVHAPVAVFVSRFPLITETFILREIIELERQNQPVVLVPMVREHPAVVHEEAKPWIERALYTPFISTKIVLANLKAWVRSPRAAFRTLLWIVGGALFRPNTLFKTLIVVPKSIYIGTVLKEMGVAHIHAHFATFPAAMARIASLFSGIPYSFTVHAHDIFVERTLLREKIRDAVFIRSISNFNKAYLESLYPAETSGKISVVHVGIEPNRYEATEARQLRRPVRLLTVAALKPYKGIPTLIDACALLSSEGADFRCDVIGDGPQRSQLLRRIERTGLASRVSLRGPLPQHAVAEAIRDCDIFVLPSIIAADNQMEGIPVALMEAMAANKPVIASAISGIPELVIDRETGILFDMANPRQLANAITFLINNSEVRARISERARPKVVRDFSLTTCVAALIRQFAPLSQERDPLIIDTATAFGDGSAVGVRRVHRRSDSLVLEAIVSTENGPAEVVFKRQVLRAGESRPPQVRAADEQRILLALREHFASSGSGVPHVLSYDEGRSTIVMNRAAGVSLETLIRRGSGGAAATTLAVAASGAGAWLARFQLFESGSRADAIERIYQRAIVHLDSAGERLPLRTERRIRRRLQRLAATVRSRDGRSVSHHGDLWPGNVFAHRSSVDIIDFEGYCLSLPAEDIAYFLLHTRLYYAFGRRRGRGFDIIEREFLRGYAAAVDETDLEFCHLTSALTLLASDDGSMPALNRLVRSAAIRRELSR